MNGLPSVVSSQADTGVSTLRLPAAEDRFAPKSRSRPAGGTYLVAIWLLLAHPAFAQRIPDLGYMFPPGGRAGSTVEVRLGGYDWTPDMEYFVLDPRVQLAALGPPGDLIIPPPPYWFGTKSKIVAIQLAREVPARLTIPAGMPPGIVYWQAANANGGTATGILVVGDGSEVVEDERRRGVQALPDLPVTVSGRLSKIEEVDAFRFVVPKAGPVTCDLMARRLGSNFHGVLEIRDKAGRIVADVADAEGNDASLTFAATAGGEYVVSVRDIDHAGDRSLVYRMSVTAGPRVLAAIPAAGRRGETRPVEFVGLGVASGTVRLESVTREVTFPADPAAKEFNYRLETPFGTAPSIALLVTDLPESVDPPRTDETPRLLALPAAVTGVLDRRFREDGYEFAAKKGEIWSIALEARRIASPLDVAFVVLGPDGKALAQSDDLPGTTDAGLDFTAPADGVFRVVVSDRSGKSGARDAIYRLEIRRPVVDFQLQTLERVNVLIGGKLDLVVKARRSGGFSGPIAVTFSGLPAGVSVPPNLVIPADKAELSIPVQAAADTVASSSLASVTGTAQVGTANVTRIAMCPAAGNLIPRTPNENDIPRMLVTSMMRPRFKGQPVDQDTGRKVNRGTTFPAEVIVERLEGFTGEIILKQAARQSYQVQGITGGDVKVPPGVERTIYPCFMPEWLETSRTSRMGMIGVVQAPDPTGRIRHLVVEMTGFITMSMEGALLKLSHTSRDLIVRPGEPFDVHIRLTRSPKLPEAARLTLRLPEELTGLFTADELVLPPGQEEVNFRITPAADSRLAGVQSIVVRATVLQDGYLPAVSETTVAVEFPPAITR